MGPETCPASPDPEEAVSAVPLSSPHQHFLSGSSRVPAQGSRSAPASPPLAFDPQTHPARGSSDTGWCPERPISTARAEKALDLWAYLFALPRRNMGPEWGSNVPKATQQIHGPAVGLEYRLDPELLFLLPLSFFFFFFFFFNVYLFLRDRERQSTSRGGAERERGRHRIRSRLRAPSHQHRARRGARTHRPRDRDLAEVGRLTDCATQAPPSLAF